MRVWMWLTSAVIAVAAAAVCFNQRWLASYMASVLAACILLYLARAEWLSSKGDPRSPQRLGRLKINQVGWVSANDVFAQEGVGFIRADAKFWPSRRSGHVAVMRQNRRYSIFVRLDVRGNGNSPYPAVGLEIRYISVAVHPLSLLPDLLAPQDTSQADTVDSNW